MGIGQHGSWNRRNLSGCKAIFVPHENGKPSGPARDILSGFLAPDEKVAHGRPVGVTIGPNDPVALAAISIRIAPEIRYDLIVCNNGSDLSASNPDAFLNVSTVFNVEHADTLETTPNIKSKN